MILPPFLIKPNTNPPEIYPTTVDAACNPGVLSWWKLPDDMYDDHVKAYSKLGLAPKSKDALLHDFYVTANRHLVTYTQRADLDSSMLAKHGFETPVEYVAHVIYSARSDSAIGGAAAPFEMVPPHGEYSPRDIMTPSDLLPEFSAKKQAVSKQKDSPNDDGKAFDLK